MATTANCGIYTAQAEKLRTSGPMPYSSGAFLTQTFGVDRSTITVYTASNTIRTKSDNMAGASIGGSLVSASWQQLPYLSEEGGNIYRGNTVSKPTFVNKDYVGSGA